MRCRLPEMHRPAPDPTVRSRSCRAIVQERYLPTDIPARFYQKCRKRLGATELRWEAFYLPSAHTRWLRHDSHRPANRVASEFHRTWIDRSILRSPFSRTQDVKFRGLFSKTNLHHPTDFAFYIHHHSGTPETLD